MNFFWKDNCVEVRDNHKLDTLAWDKICRFKCKGGLGID